VWPLTKNLRRKIRKVKFYYLICIQVRRKNRLTKEALWEEKGVISSVISSLKNEALEFYRHFERMEAVMPKN
jgi:hypothetical protein